jgi:hypothetical protein
MRLAGSEGSHCPFRFLEKWNDDCGVMTRMVHALFLTPRPRLIAGIFQLTYLINFSPRSEAFAQVDLLNHGSRPTVDESTYIHFILLTRCLPSQSYRDQRTLTTILCCPGNLGERLQTTLEVRVVAAGYDASNV